MKEQCIPHKSNILISILLIFSFVSCKIEEGTGGNGSIKGKVYFQRTLDLSSIGGDPETVVAEYAAIDTKVYIKYGDNEIYDDDFDTDENGAFKFTNLVKGDYTIFVYDNCDECGENNIEPVYQYITLQKHNSEISEVTFYIEEE